jgi:hypothetical protein
MLLGGRFLEVSGLEVSQPLVWAEREMDSEPKVCRGIAGVANECSETHACSPSIWTDVGLSGMNKKIKELEESLYF